MFLEGKVKFTVDSVDSKVIKCKKAEGGVTCGGTPTYSACK